MNFSDEIEELIVKECRFAYVKQTSSEYRIFSLFTYIFTNIFAVSCLVFWYKKRHLPRIAARPFPILLLLYFAYFLDTTSSWLVIATSDSRNFLNSCLFTRFVPLLVAFLFLMAMVMKLLFYYFRYRLCLSFSKRNFLMTEEYAKSESTNIGKKQFYYTTNRFVIKSLAITSLVIIFVLSGFAYTHCPDINPEPLFACPNEAESNVELVIYSIIGCILLGLIGSISYATIKFHDPFGIVREVLIVTILYVTQIITYGLLQDLLQPSVIDGKYAITPYAPTAFFSFLVFCVILPMQLYLAHADKNEEPTLKEIIENPTLMKLLKLQLQYDWAVEQLNFYLAVKHYKRTYHINLQESLKVAQEIVKRFVDPLGKESINVGYYERKTVLDAMKEADAISSNIFDELQGIVFRLMQDNSYYRFINGPLYKLYIGLDIQLESELSSML